MTEDELKAMEIDAEENFTIPGSPTIFWVLILLPSKTTLKLKITLLKQQQTLVQLKPSPFAQLKLMLLMIMMSKTSPIH